MAFRPWMVVVAALVVGSCAAWGQDPEFVQPVPQPAAAGQPAQAASSDAQPAAAPAVASADPAAGVPAKKTFVVPAGTKVLLQLRSSVNTKSAKPGDGVYLASTFPVVVGNHVLIPAGVYVQGMVDHVARAGHVKGHALLDMHFTSMIFPNGTVVEIPGLVNSLPGANKQHVKGNGEGTIEEEGDKARNMGKVAAITIPAGTTGGAIGGGVSGHPVEGTLGGMAGGLAAAGIVALFTRGADVDLQAGSQVEMVLQRPLMLEEENLSAATGFPALVPAADQPKPMEKPKAHVLCPPGGLGCE
ncbi:TrbI/VirB10 family protein [Occallatibacter riparius]|uniref:TrbI/VirB10 family protein n=1 Tax=Occallatibacter riparius TaxID=1002689 RepID=A0A9J7BJH8_9BACT|nr:TrbI/VirB10 family protein [Occallatibacter riparius]UWZ83060.1 TrbI/VirB10 family protein [Occallatibacter riparius]